MIEIQAKKEEALGCSLPLARGASGIDATLIDQEPDQAVHRGIVGAADERRRLTLLSHQARQDQPMQVVGERRGGDAEFLLQVTNRQPLIACPNERPVKLEACRVAKRFKLLRCFFDFHGNNRNSANVGRQVIFLRFSKFDPIAAVPHHRQWLSYAPPTSVRSPAASARQRTRTIFLHMSPFSTNELELAMSYRGQSGTKFSLARKSISWSSLVPIGSAREFGRPARG
jgi:hypothetical protein